MMMMTMMMMMVVVVLDDGSGEDDNGNGSDWVFDDCGCDGDGGDVMEAVMPSVTMMLMVVAMTLVLLLVAWDLSAPFLPAL